MAKARVQAKLKVNHVAVRMEKAGHNERGNVATDIQLTGQLHLEQAEKLLQDIHASAILRACFDAEGGLRTPTFTAFTVGTQIKDATVTLGSGELRTPIKDASLDNISLVPQPGNLFDFKARLQANLPPKQQQTVEYEFLKDTINVIVEGGERFHEEDEQPGLGLTGGGEKEEEAEGVEA